MHEPDDAPIPGIAATPESPGRSPGKRFDSVSRWRRTALIGLAASLPFSSAFAAPATPAAAVAHPAHGWLGWRGPAQDGSAHGAHLAPFTSATKPLWTYDLHGRGTPVVADGRLYATGYRGEGPDLREVLVALDAETGKLVWEHAEADFLSDTIYDRYAIGAPAVDAQTGNVYAMTANGVFSAFDRDGKLLWQHSMMEEYGRLTFPNSRNGAPVIDDDLVIVRGITSNWGAQAPPKDRFYAFDKVTGAAVWASAPGDAPKDNSFSTPVLGWIDGKDGPLRVFYAGSGCGNVVAVNARTGAPLWRRQIAAGGVNASVLVDKERLIAVHGAENVGTSATGAMVAIDLAKANAKRPEGADPVVLDGTAEAWRADVSSFSGSPVRAGDRVYVVSDTGELIALDAKTGKTRWKLKLGRDQIHASPLLADGLLYVPMNDGTFHVVKPGESSGKEVAALQLEGNGLGAPAVWSGKLYVLTTGKLYAFGKAGAAATSLTDEPAAPRVVAGAPSQLAARPVELLLRPGDRVQVAVRKLDARGFDAGEAGPVTWKKFIPKTAKVRSFLDADFDASGTIVASAQAKPSAGAFEATTTAAPALTGTLRGRLVAALPIAEDFESYPVTEPHPTEKGVLFGWPPLPWIGGRVAWEVRQVGSNKVLAKTMDNPIRQRAQTFIGHPDMRDYTVAADVMSEGNKRLMSDVGVINQRYLVSLKGTWQQLEISSNHERFKVSVPFAWKPGAWYRIKTRVDRDEKGDVIVRAKAWPKESPEPAAWSIEAPHKAGHAHGSPGLFGFVPQSRFRVFVDNVAVTSNTGKNAQ